MCPTIDMTKIVYPYFAISLLQEPYKYGKKNFLCTEAAHDRMRGHRNEEPRNAVISIPWLFILYGIHKRIRTVDLPLRRRKFYQIDKEVEIITCINNFIELREAMEILLSEQKLSQKLISELHGQAERTLILTANAANHRQTSKLDRVRGLPGGRTSSLPELAAERQIE